MNVPNRTSIIAKKTKDIIKKLENKQQLDLENAQEECISIFGERCLNTTLTTIYNDTIKSNVCPAYFDSVLCWPDTLPGTELSQPCPSFFIGFNPEHNATRLCTENGTWFVHPVYKNTWTNYTNCYDNSFVNILADLNFTNITTQYNQLIMKYLPVINLTSNIGYMTSFITLLLAFIIMLSFRKLHCARNILHMHTFASFILRAFIILLIAFSFEGGLDFKSKIQHINESTYYSIDLQASNWECKLLSSLFQYFITANYAWLLIEGLYLHNLIFRALHINPNHSIKWYVIIGWTAPLLLTVCWVILRLLFEDTLCWTIHDTIIVLIIIVPTTISCLINFLLFIRITMVLYRKLKSTINENLKCYQKLVKAALVLASLFGVHYAFFLLTFFWSFQNNEVGELVWLFCDQLFSSFQGFFVAILYCFLNGEVKTELKLHILNFFATNKYFQYIFLRRSKLR